MEVTLSDRILELARGSAAERAQLPPAGFIGTMPRSGTWYLSLTLRFYDDLLQGRPMSVPGGGEAYAAGPTALGVRSLAVFHAVSPGFVHYQGALRERWEALRPVIWSGYDLFGDFMEEARPVLDPGINPNARIGYLYRNPLDQMVSMYQHTRDHAEMPREVRAADSPRAYLELGGLDSYLKQFFTYVAVQSLFPEQVYLLRYEDLVRRPFETVTGLLRFLGHDPERPGCAEKLALALRTAAPDSVRQIERQLGHAIANDQVHPETSHIKDGRIGKWREHFDAQDRRRVAEALADFGIPEELFVWE